MGLLGNKTNKRELNTFKQFGKDTFASGAALTGEALGSLDELDSQFSDRLASGNVLTPEMERAFGTAQGRLTDEAQRSRSAFGAELLQIARRTGGRLDPNAALDASIEQGASVDDTLFNSRNELAETEAEFRLDETNRLLDRVMAIRDRKLGVGEADKDRGISAWDTALQMKQRRSLARAQMASSIVTGGASSIAAGYGRK